MFLLQTTGELRRGNSIKVRTAGDGAMCGVSLSIGTEYYLRGNTLKQSHGTHTKVRLEKYNLYPD